MKAAVLLSVCLFLSSCSTGFKHLRQSAVPATSTVVARADAPASDLDAGDGKENDSPEEAAEFYLLRRTGGAPLPVEKMLAAKRAKAAMPVHSLLGRGAKPLAATDQRDANVGTWQPLGPGNIGGRTRGLVIRPDNPNTMYAGSVGGGVWKTTDGGQSWNPLMDLLPSIGISALAMDPNNPDTLYAGTGEYYTTDTRGDSIRGVGIYKTTDGGASWVLLPKAPGNAFDEINKVVVSPNNSQNIYVATWAGIYFSPDGGNTWQLQLQRFTTLRGCQDLVIRSDQSTDYLFAACAYSNSPNPAIYRNTDAAGSGSWQVVFTVANMARTSLALAPSNQSIVYAAVATFENGTYHNGLLGVVRSTSNGDPNTWEMRVSNKDSNPLNTVLFSNPRGFFAPVCTNTAQSLENQGWYDNAIAVDPTNPDAVWVGGIDLFRSDDGGQNWGIAAFWENTIPLPLHAHADNHVIVFPPNYDGAGNQTMLVASDGGIYRTDNALATTATGPRAACSPYTTSVVWYNLNNGYAATQFYHGVVYPGGAAYIGGTQDNETIRGSDATGPQAWTTPRHSGDGGFVAIDPTDPTNWYASGVNLNFTRTANGGVTFLTAMKGITEDSANFLFIAPWVMDPSEPKRLYTGGKTLWRTTDGAQNWSEASSAIPSNAGTISAIAISPSDPNQAVFGTSSGFVFRNNGALGTNKSTVWSSSQPRAGFISHLEYDPSNPSTVYATYSEYKQDASQSHIYKSSDGGATWSGSDGSGASSIPDIPVFTVLADPQNPSNLYAGSDVGVFVSLDGGASWSRDDNPFADAVTETLAIDRGAGQSTLFAFTHGRGVWKTALPGSGDPCQYSVSTNSIELPAWGSKTTVQVNTADGCVYSLFPTQEGNFAFGAPAVRKGSSSIAVSNNFFNNTRSALSSSLYIQDKTVSITQDAPLVASGNPMASPFSVGTLPAVVIENTTSVADSPGGPVHSCTSSADSKSVWFTATAPSTASMTVFFMDRRVDNGADAGAVLSLYRVVNGAAGAEFGCTVVPQSTASTGLKGLQFGAMAGTMYLIEVSATTSGAPAGATAMGGNLTLAVVMAGQ